MIQSPDPQYSHHVEITSLERPPFDVRLKDDFNSKVKCKNCGKYIYRGITKNMKKIPISLIVDPWGASIPAVHWEVCKKKF